MKYVSLFITVPLVFLTILIAVSNPPRVSFRLAPLEGFAFDVPLFVPVVAALLAGLFVGALLAWLYACHLRLELWRQKRRADRLEQELEAFEKKSGLTAAE